MASTAVFAKHYAHKSVQTELPAFLEPSPVITSIGVKAVPGPTEGAYMQLSFTESTQSSSRNNPGDQKYRGITSQRPSLLQTRSSRVSSLPNQQISDPDPIPPARRIVSMPDGYLDNGTLRTQYMRDIPDDVYFSIEPDPRGDGQHQYMGDFPRTPSPSSPDSITIIGNDFHVPDLLHRRQNRKPDWTSWASSPPKPIPALHGPLSLPYARCPSGAEGTVIDGDDLPHKIWGLGLDEVQPQTKATRVTLAPQAQVGSAWPQTSKPNRIYATRYSSEGVINLVEPRSILLTKELHRSVLKASSTLDSFSSHVNNVIRPRPHVAQHNRMNSIDLATLIPRQDLTTAPRYHYTPLEKRNTAHSSIGEIGARPSGRLNTAAQVFIPSNNNSSAIGAGTREAMSDFPSTISFLGNQQMSRPEAELPTPPPTVSPEWSPVFPYPALPSLTSISGLSKLLDNPLEGSLQNMSILDSCGYSPYLDGFDDHAASIMAYMRQLREQELVINRQESYLDVRHGSHSSGPSVLGSRNYGSNTMSCVNINVEGSTVEDQETQCTSSDSRPDQLTASDRRRNLTSQHPRSIPLARLIQRRLSSVVEEDNSIDKLLPVHKQRPVYQAVQPRSRGGYGFQGEPLEEGEPKAGDNRSKIDTSQVVESDGSSITSTSSGTPYHQYTTARSRRDGQTINSRHESMQQKTDSEVRQPNREAHKKKYKSKRRSDP